MTYVRFLDILTNGLPYVLIAGVAASIILLCNVTYNIIMKRRHDGEFPEAITTELVAESPGKCTKRKLVDLLKQMEEEKSTLCLRLDDMSQTQRETAEAWIQKIEDRMAWLINNSEYLPD